MPKGKWTGKVPNGKIVDAHAKRNQTRLAIDTMRATERQLILDRRQIGALMRSFPQGSRQWKRYSNQMDLVNKKLSKVSDFLRG